MDFWDSAFRMLSALAVVLALMMVVVAVARRVMGTRLCAPAAAPLVRVLGGDPQIALRPGLSQGARYGGCGATMQLLNRDKTGVAKRCNC